MNKYFVYIYLNNEYVKCALLEDCKGSYKFNYGKQYLKRVDAVPVDPANIPLYDKTYESEEIFGSIKDCSPDRWGRYLLEKKFNRELSEIEYILANGIDHVGGLAFSPYESDKPKMLTPIGYINHGIDKIDLEVIMDQTELVLSNEEDKEKLRELLLYGPSLGGARPKYCINIKKEAYLAKYSISQDRRKEPLIEFACMKLAKDFGLNVPDIKLGKILKRDVLYIKRFDRELSCGVEIRKPFLSALSLCEWYENSYADWSYPVFAQLIRQVGSTEKNIKADLLELFKRVAFNIALNNNDDHPRNHGVYYNGNEWRLSPLYDVVSLDSQTQSFSLSMELGVDKKVASKKNLLSAIEYFEIGPDQANKIIDDVNTFISKNWRKYFSDVGLSTEEVSSFENAMSVK